MENSKDKGKAVQVLQKILFFVLISGSVIFFIHLIETTEASGMGDGTILSIWGLRRGLLSIGNYLIFLAIIFGINSLLIKKE